MPKRYIITVKIDITDQLERKYVNPNWANPNDQDIIEYFGDSPELIQEAINENGFFMEEKKKDACIVKKVERV